MKNVRKSIKLDNRPLYDRTIEALIQFIKQGDLQPGEKLPSEGELAKQLGISRPTLREAIGNLESKGIITRRHGVGTFVSASAQGIIRGGLGHLESLRSLGDYAGVTTMRGDWVITTVPADVEIAEKLETKPGGSLIRVQSTTKLDECFFAYLNDYVLPEYVDIEELENFGGGSFLDYLLYKTELKLSYTNTDLFAVEADKEIAGWLRIEPGKALMYLAETFYTDKNLPVLHAKNYFITECMNFRIVRRIIQKS